MTEKKGIRRLPGSAKGIMSRRQFGKMTASLALAASAGARADNYACYNFPDNLNVDDNCKKTIQFISDVTFGDLYEGELFDVLVSCLDQLPGNDPALPLVFDLMGALEEYRKAHGDNRISLKELFVTKGREADGDKGGGLENIDKAARALAKYMVVPFLDRKDGERNEIDTRFFSGASSGSFGRLRRYTLREFLCGPQKGFPDKAREAFQHGVRLQVLTKFSENKLHNGLCCEGGTTCKPGKDTDYCALVAPNTCSAASTGC